MRKRTVSGFMTAVLLSVLLSGCQKDVKQEVALSEESVECDVRPLESSVETETRIPEESSTQAEVAVSAPKLQFVKEYGIIQSEYPVDTLDTAAISELTQGKVTIRPVSIIQNNQNLLVSLIIDDYSDRERIEAGEEIPEDGRFFELSDGTNVSSERYREDIWRADEGLRLTGPDIPVDGYQPKEAVYVAYELFYKEYGYMRHFIDATFELPTDLDFETHPSGYSFLVLDFEHPLEFTMKRAAGYDTIEELAAGEQGGLGTHDGFSIVLTGEKYSAGIAMSGYMYSESGDRPASMTYGHSLQVATVPLLSNGEKEYPLKIGDIGFQADELGAYRLPGINWDGRRARHLFDVPPEEQDGKFSVMVPGITFPTGEVSPEITLPIPEDSEELTEDIAFGEGTVRILKITRMKEPQKENMRDNQGTVTEVIERPAVYLDVEAVSEEKEVALKGLICKRKLDKGGWEHQRYDFNEDGNLSGFRVFYDEGDTEITLQFNSPAIYWKQEFKMELPIRAE